jgi:pyruvate formate-lyase activating enzyme-like uncharacterized protein
MTTVTIDEITRNAILAALDERAARLNKEVARLQKPYDAMTGAGVPQTEDTQRAIVWNIAALHETNMARLTVAEADSWAESEMAGAFGR